MKAKAKQNRAPICGGRRLNQLVHEEKDLKKALEIFQVEMKEECVHQELPHFRQRSPDPGPSIAY